MIVCLEIIHLLFKFYLTIENFQEVSILPGQLVLRVFFYLAAQPEIWDKPNILNKSTVTNITLTQLQHVYNKK